MKKAVKPLAMIALWLASATMSAAQEDIQVGDLRENSQAATEEYSRVLSREGEYQVVLLLVPNDEELQRIGPTIVAAAQAALLAEENNLSWLLVGTRDDNPLDSRVIIFTDGVETSFSENPSSITAGQALIDSLARDRELMDAVNVELGLEAE